MLSWLHSYRADVVALAFNLSAFAVYRALHRRRSKADPGATLQSMQAATRATWVHEVLASGNGILGVQTLRNAIMASVFFASNTMFLVMGTLSLTAHAGGLASTWSSFDVGADGSAPFVQVKLLLLMLTLLASFFAFLNALRSFVHASVSIGSKSADPQLVIAQMERGWRYQGIGVRGYYFSASLVFWCFGVGWFVLATALALATMHVFDDASSLHGIQDDSHG